ncbi:MAG: type II toxin-antitoxin system RelB/DinJ family antitoxin [Clostridiales bacterium]|jgi:addiction module RelB/DinJ family antitoxin|nr:type II toxin-antitoxin system RelB/DinJ family antitoxin [Clostridiales bacterium]
MSTNTAKSETLQVRINKETKKQAESILKEMGLSTRDAINIYFAQIINTNGIPFIIRAKTPNKTTLEAFQEIEEIKSGKLPRNPQTLDGFIKEMGE